MNQRLRNRFASNLVTVSRSVISGYTPAEQAGYIENRLISGLSQIDDLEIVSFSDL
jgi:hypothetical protein